MLELRDPGSCLPTYGFLFGVSSVQGALDLGSIATLSTCSESGGGMGWVGGIVANVVKSSAFICANVSITLWGSVCPVSLRRTCLDRWQAQYFHDQSLSFAFSRA